MAGLNPATSFSVRCFRAPDVLFESHGAPVIVLAWSFAMAAAAEIRAGVDLSF
jgi:hypothetical protein